MSCRKQLRTLRSIAAPFGSAVAWRKATLDEEARLVFEMQDAMDRNRDRTALKPFARWPADVPCSNGIPISAEEWASGPLAHWIATPSQRMPASFELNVSGTQTLTVTLHAFQNFNCDSKVGITEAVWLWDPVTFKHTGLRFSSPDPFLE